MSCTQNNCAQERENENQRQKFTRRHLNLPSALLGPQVSKSQMNHSLYISLHVIPPHINIMLISYGNIGYRAFSSHITAQDNQYPLLAIEETCDEKAELDLSLFHVSSCSLPIFPERPQCDSAIQQIRNNFMIYILSQNNFHNRMNKNLQTRKTANPTVHSTKF